MTEFEVGYLMGLIVGEGSFTGDRKKYRLDINLHESDLQPLITVKNLLGGRINGPYEHAGRKFWAYRLESRQLRTHLRLFYERLPRSRKREQFLKWAEKWNLAFWET
jgi:hypothetical protein